MIIVIMIITMIIMIIIITIIMMGAKPGITTMRVYKVSSWFPSR